MSQAIYDAYMAEINAPDTGLDHLPYITICSRHACRLGRITTAELAAIEKRIEEREDELTAPEPARQKSLF